jgi:hypothetical protein
MVVNIVNVGFSDLKMEAVGSSESLIAIYQTTWRHISEISNI